MSWSSTPVNGQQSVASNKTPLNDAFTYIDTTQKIDHYWDNGNSNLDGRHQFVQMPKTTNTVSGIIRPNFGTDMDGIFYCRQKTAGEAPSVQLVEPFFVQKNGSNRHTLQLGIRAMISFTVNQSTFALTTTYAQNCSVARTAAGLFTLTFTTALPSSNYILFGSAMRASGNNLFVSIQNAAAKGTSITTSSCKFATVSSSDSARDPLVVMVAVVGG